MRQAEPEQTTATYFFVSSAEVRTDATYLWVSRARGTAKAVVQPPRVSAPRAPALR